MIYTESAIPPKICVNNTAVAIYLATSINHFPISLFMLQRYAIFFIPPNNWQKIFCVSKSKITF